MPLVLLTGATGYIGSHTWVALCAAGFDVLGVDNFANSSPAVLPRIAHLIGRTPRFEHIDVNDSGALAATVARHGVDAAVHFAAHKAVGESMQKPLAYFRNNLGGLVSLAEALQANGSRRLVFSSSATVYGSPKSLPIREDAELSATNPYGLSKLHGEQLLRELERCDPAWQVACLRYFNPVGAHESGLIGEDPRGVPNNLMPYVAQVAVGRRAELQVHGSDYDTVDGTGVRDYIHVMDLAEGHVAALRHLFDGAGSLTANLGTGRGHSVLEVLRAYERASGRRIAHHVGPRRPGDVAACYADAELARQRLGWQARRDLDAMCADSWRWQSMNPQGFETTQQAEAVR
ncbi:UDP-glucose 4-epimerase GalE [Rivibacter subsaxonicus]|uniref:UDP-glucose 4-epimerase n=1 Tax=Rivibacter subsaxonicus TaxID=457575 RepID=A0A4Q7VZG9_9BURK|nr:UDP-glucose 4-epimerase GalE [Rivibacter subsaxonicus]RZU02274.1 UDP-galactose 4-epimerase [Rivibacter subsaxonicus]